MPEQIIGIFIGLLFVFILLLIAAANIKIVPQATVFVIERLGTYYATWETGCTLRFRSSTELQRRFP